ncbi:hypothetical protein [Nocardioides halotolerans]|uniref:hypothetical protein n=1 Tax=Nocardioides halotolerans TaxID=433660 RepID=UPI0012FB55B0|nr:hypothetical protein [Nocardioides halotolerans]
MLPDLRIDVPELEPPAVLLEQLAQLSRQGAASAPHDGPGIVKAFLAAVSVSVLASVAWLTGTLPGVASPFTREPETRPAPQHAAAEPGTLALADEDTEADAPPAVADGHAGAHHGKAQHGGRTTPPQDNGHHTGQTKPHQNNGHHTGQTKPHQNNGHHTGQTKPHQNNGHHTGQTKPHQDNGHHSGQTKPHVHGNGHRS